MLGSAQPTPPPGETTVFTVLLEAPSVGQRLARSVEKDQDGPVPRSQASTEWMRREVARAQDPVVQALRARGLKVLGVVRNVLNAVFVRAGPDQEEWVGSLPGVAGVAPGRRYEPMLQGVSEIVRVSAARIRPVGTPLYGEGLKIAIIDSGLDFDHEAFLDSALPPLAGYPRGDPQYLGLAGTKVVAVRSYVDLLNSRQIGSSTPDDVSPWDLSGHGTAVAMIAAGRRVETPLGPTSGIAPKARIGVYKVFGTPGLNFHTADHAVMMAIDDAVADDMDILNLSLGNPTYFRWDAVGRDCGRASLDSPCDPLAMAAQSAVEDFGKVVVVAAGNEGLRGSEVVPARTSINSPADAPAVITVGSTGNSARLQESVRLGERSFEALSGSGPDAPGPLTAAAALAADVGDPLGCEPFPAGAFQGRIAVIDRSECLFLVKVEHADEAGAVGVVVINHEGDELVEMALLGSTDIPAFFVGGSDGEAIRQAMAESPEPLTLDPTPLAAEDDWEYVVVPSSRGPTLALHPKPDLVAPGQVVLTAVPRYNNQGVLFAPSGFRTQSGTSFAAPVVAGAAALVRQAYPSLDAREVSSALINSARPMLLEDGAIAPIVSAGAGTLDIQAALRSNAAVVPASLGFGSLQNSPFPIRRTLQVRNKSGRSQGFLLTVEPQESDAGPALTIAGRSAAVIRVAPRASSSVRLTLGGRHPQPGAYQGRLRISSLAGNGDVLVPYLYVMGDNEPYNALRFQGASEVGTAGEAATKNVVARVVDQYGAPVTGHAVTFAPEEGSPRIVRSTPASGPTGLVWATIRYSGEPEPQSVVARMGDLEIPFWFEASGSEPSVHAIANGASQSPAGGIAPGSLATIAGAGLAEFASGAPAAPQTRLLPVSRKGVTVAFDAPSAGVSAPGRIHSVSEDAVTVQVPWELEGAGSAYVSVRRGSRSEPLQFRVVAASPGVFEYESGGVQYAVALHADDTLVTPESPARRGETVTVSMTGNGAVRVQPPTGAAGGALVSTVRTPQVRLGGVPAAVTYSGLDPAMAGVYLIAIVIPEGVASGPQPLQVVIDGAASNEVQIPVL